MRRASQDAGSSQARFRSGLNIIQLDVSTLDRDSHPVARLAAPDLSVEIDGQLRTIVAFVLPVDSLAPGRYLLRLDLKSSGPGAATRAREAARC